MAKMGTGFQSILTATGSTLKVGAVDVVEGGTIDNNATLVLTVGSGSDLVAYSETLTTSRLEYDNPMGFPETKYFPKLDPFKKSSIKIASDSYSTIGVFLYIEQSKKYTVLDTPEFNLADKLLEYGATLKKGSVNISAGSELLIGDVLTLEIGEGYVLSEDLKSSLAYFNSLGSLVELPFIRSGESETVATFEIPDIPTTDIYFLINAEQVTNLQIASNNVYLIDYDKLKQINVERYSDISTPDGIDRFDYGVNILSVLNVPFAIPSEIILNPSEIVLGDKVLTVLGSELETDLLVIDLGSIEYLATEGNLLDYSNKVFNLFLPYSQPIALEAEYVVNETINIEYRLDLYTGDADILIRSSAVNSVVIMQKTTIGIDVPYSTQNQNSINAYNDSIVVGGFNDLYRPYLELMENKAVLPYGIFTAIVPDEGVFNTFNGFLIVEDIKLECGATTSEKQEIISQLNSGVFINA